MSSESETKSDLRLSPINVAPAPTSDPEPKPLSSMEMTERNQKERQSLVTVTTENPSASTSTLPPSMAKPPLSTGAKIALILLSPLILIVVLLVFLLVGLYTLVALPCLLKDTFGRHPASAANKPSSIPSSASTGASSGAYFKSPTAAVWLYYQRWSPAADIPVRGIVFVAHGFGEHCHRGGYDLLAHNLNSKGLVVIALDHQGHGFSTGTRAYAQKFQHYITDFIYFTHLFDSEFPPTVPRFLFGHSMGGLIAVTVAVQVSIQAKNPSTNFDTSSTTSSSSSTPSPWQYRGAIFSAPATVVDPELATPALRFAAKVLSFLAPKKPLDPLPPVYISRNKEAVEKYIADELNFTGGIRARLANEMLMTQDWVNPRLNEITMPVLCVQGSQDKIVMVKSSESVFENVGTPAAEKELRLFDGAYHEVQEDELEAQNYFDAVANFCSKRLS